MAYLVRVRIEKKDEPFTVLVFRSRARSVQRARVNALDAILKLHKRGQGPITLTIVDVAATGRSVPAQLKGMTP